jgi:hypothetical protein
MSKLSKISDDVLDKKVDYSELTEEAQNENPLKKGQTIDFQGVLERQMQKGFQNAARVMKPAAQAQEAEDAVKTEAEAYAAETKEVETAESNAVAANTDAAAGNTSGFGSYRMQQAISAYTAFDMAV